MAGGVLTRFNKWTCIAGLGLLSIALYGITTGMVNGGLLQSVESKEYIDLRTNQKDLSSLSQGDALIPIPASHEIKTQRGKDNKPKLPVSNPKTSSQIVVQDSRIVTDSNADVSYSDYVVDSAYLNSLGKSSMGWKFQKYVILSPKDSKIWNAKAEQLKKKALETNTQKNFFVVNNRAIYDVGNKRLWDISKINGEQMYELCTDILSYNDGGIGFSQISRLTHKGFFDFVWDNCGRGDKTKPNDGRFAKG